MGGYLGQQSQVLSLGAKIASTAPDAQLPGYTSAAVLNWDCISVLAWSSASKTPRILQAFQFKVGKFQLEEVYAYKWVSSSWAYVGICLSAKWKHSSPRKSTLKEQVPKLVLILLTLFLHALQVNEFW